MTAPTGGTSAVLYAVAFLIFAALATAGFGWMTGRKSVAVSELETALEFFKGEAEMARELRRENHECAKNLERLEKELADVRTVALGLQRKVDALEAQIGDSRA